MRNKFPGTCYRCGKLCEKGQGHFEKVYRGWRVQHADCAIKYRGTDKMDFKVFKTLKEKYENK